MDGSGAEIDIGAPVVPVRYERMTSDRALLRVDGAKLGEALVGVGYSDKVAATPLVITGQDFPGFLACFNPRRGEIEISQPQFVRRARVFYADALRALGEVPPSSITGGDGLLRQFVNSRIFELVMPVCWPYLFVRRPVKFADVKRDRLERYLTEARNGPAEKREHAKRVVERLVRLSLQKYYAATVAHEYEHPNWLLRKRAASAAMMLGSVGLAVDISDGLVRAGVVLLAALAGRALEEQASYNAAGKFWGDIVGSITVNPEAFNRLVLGRSGVSK